MGIGPTQLLHVVDAAARATAPEVFKFDPIDEVDYMADVAWQKAGSAAGAAKLKYGDPSSESRRDLDTYASCWTSVMGLPLPVDDPDDD
jgi:hypothetical protein